MDDEPTSIFNYIEQDKSGKSSRVPHALAIGASTVIILAGVQAASGLVGPMLLALFLAIVLLVPLRWLQDRGCPQFVAFLFVLICTIALFVIISFFVSKSLTDFIGKIPAYKDRFVTRYTALEERLWEFGFSIGDLGDRLLPIQHQTTEETTPGKIASEEPTPAEQPKKETPPPAPSIPVVADQSPEKSVTDLTESKSGTENQKTAEKESLEVTMVDGVPTVPVEQAKELVKEWTGEETDETGSPEETTPDEVPTVPVEQVRELVKEWAEKETEPSLIALDPQSIAFWLARISLYLRDMLEGGFLVLLFTIFMLFEAAHFPAKVKRAFSKDSPINIEHFHRIAEDLRRYLFLKTVANLMSGSAAMFVYCMFGIPAAFFWGIVAFFMYYIPNIGGTLAAVIPGILIFMAHDVLGVLLYALCLLTIECAIAYGIEPKILGHGLRLSTIVIILSLFFWGFLLGPIGLFLAAPLTVMTKIILQAYPETRWIAVFLDGSREKH